MAAATRFSGSPMPGVILSLLVGQLLCNCFAEASTVDGSFKSSKILFAAPIGTKSQMSFNGEFVNILAERGHKVTLVTSYAARVHHNLRQIDCKLPLHEHMPNLFQSRGADTNKKLNDIIPTLCSQSLDNKEVQRLNISEFDVVILGGVLNDNDCFLSRMQKTKVPLILASPVPLNHHLQDIIGNPQFPSFIADIEASWTYPFSFFERISNLFLTMNRDWSARWTYLNRIESICKDSGRCDADMEALRCISRKAALVFVNSVRSLEVPPRPYVPAVIHVGCLNCRPVQPLPKDLEAWVDGSGESGFIYMSLGTVINPEDMPPSSLHTLVNVFRTIPQRVLWKCSDGLIDDLPGNVKLVTWAPQQDVLGHPKLKAFISHGGAHSTLEATYHGAPVLGLPLFYDQVSNIDKVVKEGWGEDLNWDDLSEELFKQKLKSIIENHRYREAALRRSLVMRDQPYPSQAAVAYWTEYVIRHKGAPHLRSPIADMNWIQLYNVDVWAAIALLTVTVVTMATMVVGALCRRLVSGKKTNKQKKH